MAYSKIVDMVAVTSRTQPLSGGKCERWWKENSGRKNGLEKVKQNRNLILNDFKSQMDMSVAETLTNYQFKGFEFGNWLSQAERYDVFRTFQHCSLSLSHFLKSVNIGFDYNIGVAFGARGSRGALAHYEPALNIINMTKEKGAGALLHEYAHALDYCIGAFFDQNLKYTAISGGHTITQSKDNCGGQFRYMMNKILLYVRSTDSYKLLAEKCKKPEYWLNSTELFARLTEAYFSYFYNGRYKDFYLVNRMSYYMNASKVNGSYLSKKEVEVIKPELDAFFKEVGKLLNGKAKLVKQPFPQQTLSGKSLSKSK